MQLTNCRNSDLKLKNWGDYNKSLVSLATHGQSRLNSFQTVKLFFASFYLNISTLSLF